jgi:hypothetical protein
MPSTFCTSLLIYFPKLLHVGGGFSIPPQPSHPLFLRGLQKSVSASLGDIGVAMLEYCEPSDPDGHRSIAC